MTAATKTSGSDLPARLAAVVRPVAESADIELVDVEVKGQKGSRIVRLVADAEDGLDIDRIARLSRDVGAAIDDLVDGAYTLEVTSPGTDRPLRTVRDFGRNIGREVRVQRTQEASVDEPGEVTGTVVDVADDTVTLDVDGTPVVVPLPDIAFGKVVLPW